MSNLSSVQFPSRDWNPFVAAGSFIDSVLPKDKESDKQYSNSMTQQSHTEKTTLTRHDKPTPANTGAPVPGYRKRGPINPSTTGAPVPGSLQKKTATHPITGASVPPVPVKRKGANPTAPGTRPKKK